MSNIVKAAAGKGKEITTAPLHQYDYGQILKIEGVELPTGYQVHFSNQPYGTSTTSIGTADGVAIPDAYLQSGEAVYAWLYLHTGEDDGETVLTIRIPVIQRSSITNDEPTPVQQSEIDELIIAMNAAVDAAEDAQEAAEDAQADAEDAADDAEGSAEDAEAWAVGQRLGVDVESTDAAYHNNSKYYAQQAAGSATDASTAKTDAVSAKNDAVSAKNAAVSAKEAAEGYKTDAVNAKNAAVSAKNDAVSAKNDAVSAKEAAEEAQDAAEDAESAAEDAQEAAEAARDQILGMTVTATGLPAGSDPTASYSEGVLELGLVKGDKGDQGDTGAIPQFSVGTVTTGDAGTDVAVTIGGTTAAPTLSFAIPKGPKGDTGNGTMLAPAFAEATANDAGSFVTYDGGLYFLPEGHTANTTWANTTKTLTNYANEVTSLKSAIVKVSDTQPSERDNRIWFTQTAPQSVSVPTNAEFLEVKNGYQALKTEVDTIQLVNEFEFTYNRAITTSGDTVTMNNGVPVETVISNGFSCAEMQCSAGDTIVVSGTGGNNYRLWAFIDSSGNVLERSYKQATGSNLVLVAPENAAWAILNIAETGSGYKGIPIRDYVDQIDSKLTRDVIRNVPKSTSSPSMDFSTKAKGWENVEGVATQTVSTNNNMRCSLPVEVTPYDHVSLKFQASDHSRGLSAVLVTDEDYNVLLSVPFLTDAVYDYKFVIPASGKYFVANKWNDGANAILSIETYQEIVSKADMNTADSAIKADIDKLSVALNQVSKTKNMMDYTGAEEGSISSSTGVFTPESTPATYKFLCTDFIPITPDTDYVISRNDASLGSICQGYYYYDADKTFISGATGNNSNYWSKLNAPSNAEFVRLYLYISDRQGTDGTAKGWMKEHLILAEYGEDATNQEFVPVLAVADEARDDFLINTRAFAGKTVAIIGDSISTRDGYNTPEILIGEDDVGVELSAYVTYQDVQAGLSINGTTYTSSDIGTEVTFTPAAGDVGKSIGVPAGHFPSTEVAWWQMLIHKLDMKAVNASWSGATMVSYESNSTSSDLYKASCAWFESTIRRCGIRTPGTMTRVAPDYIFVCRGVNDFSRDHAGHVCVLTNNTFDAWDYSVPQNDQVTVDNSTKYGFKEAYAKTIQALRNAYPTARIICCTITPFKRYSETYYPPKNGYYSLPQFNAAVREVAEYFGCPVCEFAEAYTFETLNQYTSDGTHANNYGRRAMYQKAILTLVQNRKIYNH